MARRSMGELDPRLEVSLMAAAVLMCCAAVLGAAPVPYAALRPGPVTNVLGPEGDRQLIVIKGRETYPTEGKLELLTASLRGGPGGRLTFSEAVAGWLDAGVVVRPAGELYPSELSRVDIEERNAAQMESSQESATAAAMNELGIEIPTELIIRDFTEAGEAAGALRVQDRILAVNDEPVRTMAALRAQLQTIKPGQQATVTVLRDGENVAQGVPTVASEEGDTLLGVLIDPVFEFPFEVSIRIDAVGGPSAGMIFALGIVDKLTPGAMTGGKVIAGTGTISSDGRVGAIGAIRQKLIAAADADADMFLAPTGNCAEVVGHVPEGLPVVAVSTLADARAAVRAVAQGSAEGLPSCE